MQTNNDKNGSSDYTCRLCLQVEKNLIHIFNSSDLVENSISSKIKACVSVEVSCDDGGPQKICEKCLYFIEDWVKFKELCESTNSLLRTYVLTRTGLAESKATMMQVLSHKDVDDMAVLTPDIHLLEQDSLLDTLENEGASCTASNMSSILRFCLDNDKINKNIKAFEGVGQLFSQDTDKDDSLMVNEFSDREKLLTVAKDMTSSLGVSLKDQEILQTTFTGIRVKSMDKLTNYSPITNNNDVLKIKIDRPIENNTEHIDVANKSRSKNIAHKSKRAMNKPKPRFTANKRRAKTCTKKTKTVATTNNSVCEMSKSKFVNKIYSCEICSSTFSKFCDLVKHDSAIHYSLSKNFVCNTCGKLYISDSRLQVHKEKHKEKQFECGVCKNKFLTPKSLSVHQRMHTSKHECSVCGYRTTSSVLLLKHKNCHDNLKFPCSVCSLKLSSEYSLLRHMKLHSKDKYDFKCTLCQQVFAESADFKYHMGTHRNEHAQHVCDKCGRTFKSRKVITQHMKRHNPPQHACSVCQTLFHTKFEVRKHKEIHTDIKKFCCEICDKKFCYKHSVTRHAFSHLSCPPTWLEYS